MPPSNVVFLSPEGEALALALKLKQEGNDVVVWVRGVQNQPLFQGILRKVDTLGEALALVRPNTLLVLDSVGGGRTADRFRKQQIRVVGGSRFTDRLEMDPTFGLGIAQRAGIIVPLTFEFDSFEEAREHVRREPRRYVFKPEKRDGPLFTHIASDANEMLETLAFFARNVSGKVRPRFRLQEFIDGVKIGTGGWFDGQRWVPPFYHVIEDKRRVVGDIGPVDRAMGNVLWHLPAPDRLAESSLLKLTPFLSKAGYVGTFNVNSIVKDVPTMIDLSPRFLNDSIFSWVSGLDVPFTEFLNGLVEGSLELSPVPGDGWTTAIRMVYDLDRSTKRYPPGLPILGISPDLLAHTWLRDVNSLGGRPVSAGVNGNLLAVTATEGTLDLSRTHALERMRHIQVPQASYRTDIGASVARDLEELAGWLVPIDSNSFQASLSSPVQSAQLPNQRTAPV